MVWRLRCRNACPVQPRDDRREILPNRGRSGRSGADIVANAERGGGQRKSIVLGRGFLCRHGEAHFSARLGSLLVRVSPQHRICGHEGCSRPRTRSIGLSAWLIR